MNKNRKGFTLVELIVVVTIFGVILGAILNMIKPANNVYHDADATMESNIIGSGLIDYLDDELRYSTNVLVLKDYIGVPDVSTSGTIGGSGVTYSNCIVIDNNNLQIDGPIDQVSSPDPIDEKLAAFGFSVTHVDGHNLEELEAAYKKARETKGKPSAIIAHTVKGKGVSFMENQAGWHGQAPGKEQYEQAMAELGGEVK